MNNRVITKKKQNKEIPYPKLMIDNNSQFVVLMRKPCTGMLVVVLSGHREIGEYSQAWAMSQFSDFHKAVKLKNS